MQELPTTIKLGSVPSHYLQGLTKTQRKKIIQRMIKGGGIDRPTRIQCPEAWISLFTA